MSESELACVWAPRRMAALADGRRLCEGCEGVLVFGHALCGFCRALDQEFEERRKRQVAEIHNAPPVKGARPEQPRIQMGIGPVEGRDDATRVAALVLCILAGIASWAGLIWSVSKIVEHVRGLR